MILVLALASNFAEPPSLESTRPPIDPVKVTARKVKPSEAEEEIRGRAFQKLEQQLQARAEDLARNRNLWNSLNITSYEYTIDFEGGWIDLPPMLIVVKDGELNSIRRDACVATGKASEQCTTQSEIENLGTIAKTIPQLFDALDSSISSALANREPRTIHVSLSFDVTYGIPTRFVFFDSTIGDAGTGFVIARFERLE